MMVVFLLSLVRPPPDAKSAYGVSPRKVPPMPTTQRTLSQLDQAREVEQNYAEVPMTIQETTRPSQSDHAIARKWIEDGIQEVTFENEAIERWLDDGGT